MPDFQVVLEGINDDMDLVHRKLMILIDELRASGVTLTRATFGAGHLLGGSVDISQGSGSDQGQFPGG